MPMSNIRTSSEDISLNDEDFDPMWIQSMEYELREEFQNRKIEYQNQKILGLENNVKLLTDQHVKLESNINLLTQRHDKVLGNFEVERNHKMYAL
ncbi:hypothetical protein F8M41_024736 [Gigaspora margarita]|uniref:Uncharacterized protein n=1 Tax=Gigaspora margarita TaxID=4874 RepID=A0A8H3XP11_GIGMA|nr:hypothetical protein F8M41_024736 [Gigaspora margarita]